MMTDFITVYPDGKIKINMNIRGRFITEAELDKEIKETLDKHGL